MFKGHRGVIGALLVGATLLGGCAVYEPGPGYGYGYAAPAPAYYSAPVYAAPYYSGSVGLSFGGGHGGWGGGHRHGWR